MRTRRRALLLGATAAVAAAAGLPRPAIAQGGKELTMVTEWAPDLIPYQPSAERLARSIETMSDGRLRIKVYPQNTLVKAFETFDAVSAGVADIYHSSDNYFGSKVPALNFFSEIPFGMTADEVSSWITFGGGQALWDEVDAPFNIKPLACFNEGVQMGGWFNREVNVPADFQGLRYRMPGLGGEVLRRMGAIVVLTPGGGIMTALKSGAIDASEWVGPWADVAMGLDKVVQYYYYPGFHEPGTSVTLGINKTLWDSFAPSDRALIEAAAQAEFTRSLAQSNAENAKALTALRANPQIKFRRFSDALNKEFGRLSKEIIAEIATKDPLTRKVADSYTTFLAGVMDWGELSETGYRNTRRLALA
jgi:TRAP-type mannitol/chloroaromatic compound transport system substrate-binding protein